MQRLQVSNFRKAILVTCWCNGLFVILQSSILSGALFRWHEATSPTTSRLDNDVTTQKVIPLCTIEVQSPCSIFALVTRCFVRGGGKLVSSACQQLTHMEQIIKNCFFLKMRGTQMLFVRRCVGESLGGEWSTPAPH